MSHSPEVVALASHALKRSPHLALRKLQVEGDDDSLILVGTVGSYYLKQLAQEALRPIWTRLRLDNRVQVDLLPNGQLQMAE